MAAQVLLLGMVAIAPPAAAECGGNFEVVHTAPTGLIEEKRPIISAAFSHDGDQCNHYGTVVMAVNGVPLLPVYACHFNTWCEVYAQPEVDLLPGPQVVVVSFLSNADPLTSDPLASATWTFEVAL